MSPALAAVVTETACLTCRTCGESKPEAEFYMGRHGKPMLDCRKCHTRRVVANRKRKEALRSAAIEAARELLAGLLRDDRNGPGLVPDLSMKTLERLETARDCLKAERASR